MRSRAPIELEHLLSPFSLDEFLADSWGKTYHYVPGTPGKFSALFPWQHLNEVLAQHRIDFPRLRLLRNGKQVSSSAYLDYSRTDRKNVGVPRIRPDRLTQELRTGATLVLNAVDEFSDTLTTLAERLELFFHERIRVNAYAGWGESQGLDLHWDDHDVFILQVSGRKRWDVYARTELYPVSGDSKPNKPSGPPLWTDLLSDGDLLYIPRGFWHVAHPLNEPTLHLTVGIHKKHGLDLLNWLVNRMRSRNISRIDLPRFASAEAARDHVNQLRTELLLEWDDDLLARYFADLDSTALPRVRFSLPHIVDANSLPAGHMLVRLLAPRPLNIKLESDAIFFSCQGKTWRFVVAVLPIIEQLEQQRICCVSDLCKVVAGNIDDHTVRTLLQELAANGLVSITEPQ